MQRKPKPKPDDKEQSRRFVETAKELEANKNKEAFERALDAVVRPQKETKTQQK
ncbi:MAG TPA: hypothetical protein VFA81_12490 [Burkholderiales bacterium]|nr:hypothetical protein [Burkholderiales bacterium]